MSGAPRAGGESEAFIAEGRRPAKKSATAEFCHFLYNSTDGTVLGRTALSWFKITLFYIVFYAGLAGFWVGCLALFLQTIDYKVPTWYGKGTIIGANPGMGYQPWISSRPDSTLIKFNVSDPASYKDYVERMDAFLAKYSKLEGTRVCSGEMNNGEDSKESCRFSLDAFKGKCDKANDYGFKEGKPCVIITLNRLIGWMPTPYPKDSVPPQVKDRYKPNAVPIFCDGEYFADMENMGQVEYIPKEGLPLTYFPYRFLDNFHQPIAMVKFNGPRHGTVFEVECKAFAYNIIHDRTDRQGMVHFELLVDGKS